MDGERKIHISEDVPLNSAGAANIFFNAGKRSKDSKVNSHDGTVIHLKTEKPSDLGVHINTTFSIASSKKLKLLFVFNFLLSVLCMILCCSIAFYYWNEMISMRRQIDMMKDHFLIQNSEQNKVVQSALVAHPRLQHVEAREPRMDSSSSDDIAKNARKYYVEDLGEDMLLVDSKKKISNKDNAPIIDLSALQKELLVVQFNGAISEINMGKQSLMGPWVRDMEVSTKGSEEKIELHGNYVTIKESGLYLVYAQVVYLTKSANCYFIWARQSAAEPRLLSTCSTGDDGSARALDKSQISCGVQAVARLHRGDTVNLAQREPDRTVWLRPGYSYFGFVKLSS